MNGIRVTWKESIPHSEYISFSDEIKNKFYKFFGGDAYKIIEIIEDNILNKYAARGSYIKIIEVSRNNKYLSVRFEIDGIIDDLELQF